MAPSWRLPRVRVVRLKGRQLFPQMRGEEVTTGLVGRMRTASAAAREAIVEARGGRAAGAGRPTAQPAGGST